MRYPAGHKETKRQDLLQASAALIKERGFAATGIDAMAEAAGVTSGAFYSHFGSKSALLKALIERELQLSTGLWAGHCEQSLENWVAYVLRHYLSLDHVRHPGSGCVLPALGAEIGRSDAAVKEVFAHELQKGIDTLAHRVGDPQLATAVVSQLLGALVLARAMPAPEQQRAVLDANKKALEQLVSTRHTSGTSNAECRGQF